MWTPGDVRGQRKRIEEMEHEARVLIQKARILREDLQTVCPHVHTSAISLRPGMAECQDCGKFVSKTPRITE